MDSEFTPPHDLNPAGSSGQTGDDSLGVHLTTFPHEGRFWDVFLRVVEDLADPETCRARLCFLPTDRADHEEPVQTAVVIIEPSYEEAFEVARAYDRYYLSAMLRSVI